MCEKQAVMPSHQSETADQAATHTASTEGDDFHISLSRFTLLPRSWICRDWSRPVTTHYFTAPLWIGLLSLKSFFSFHGIVRQKSQSSFIFQRQGFKSWTVSSSSWSHWLGVPMSVFDWQLSQLSPALQKKRRIPSFQLFQRINDMICIIMSIIAVIISWSFWSSFLLQNWKLKRMTT